MKSSISSISSIGRLFAIASVAAAVTACGGGGSATSDPSMPSVNPVAVTNAASFNANCLDGTVQVSTVSQADATAQCSTLVTNVPTPTYLAVSEEMAAFNLLNAERNHCGFGLLTQSSKLDNAAKAHAGWSLINNVYGHYQDANIPTGYTGVFVKDRAIAAGYAATSATETASGSLGNLSVSGYGVESARSLVSVPYHLFGMMSPYRDVGISVRSASSVITLVPNGLSRMAVFDFGVTSDVYQTPAAKSVMTYPCEGSTGVEYAVTGEVPNPVPGRDLALNPLGHAVLVMLPKGQTLTITSSAMTKVLDGSVVPMRGGITAENDPNNIFQTYGNYMGYVIPDVALLPATSYRVNITGKSSGLIETCPVGSQANCVVNATGSFTTTFNFSTRS